MARKNFMTQLPLLVPNTHYDIILVHIIIFIYDIYWVEKVFLVMYIVLYGSIDCFSCHHM